MVDQSILDSRINPVGNGFSSRFRSSWRGSESGGRNVKEWIKFSCLWWMKALILRVSVMYRRALELQQTGRPRIVLSILRWTLSNMINSVLVMFHNSDP